MQTYAIIFLCGAIFGTVIGDGPVPPFIVALAFLALLLRFLQVRMEGGQS